MSKNKIPSKQKFLRAKAAIRKDDHGLSELREKLLAQFKGRAVHEFIVFYSRKSDTFGAYVFYELANQVGEARKSGLEKEIEQSVFDGLEKAGRGSKVDIKVEFEFDSHENVLLNYEGDYYSRLR